VTDCDGLRSFRSCAFASHHLAGLGQIGRDKCEPNEGFQCAQECVRTNESRHRLRPNGGKQISVSNPHSPSTLASSYDHFELSPHPAQNMADVPAKKSKNPSELRDCPEKNRGALTPAVHCMVSTRRSPTPFNVRAQLENCARPRRLEESGQERVDGLRACILANRRHRYQTSQKPKG
jgi:hypothetical protein